MIPAKDGGRSVLLLAAVALGLAWLAYRTLSRGGGAGKGGDGGGAPPVRAGRPTRPAPPVRRPPETAATRVRAAPSRCRARCLGGCVPP